MDGQPDMRASRGSHLFHFAYDFAFLLLDFMESCDAESSLGLVLLEEEKRVGGCERVASDVDDLSIPPDRLDLDSLVLSEYFDLLGSRVANVIRTRQ